MLGFIKTLESMISEEREKMVGKAILYAENSEPSNRNSYMTHKYVVSKLKEVVDKYKQELADIVDFQNKKREDDVRSGQESVAQDFMKKSNPLSNVTLGSNLKSKKSNDNTDVVVAPISESKPKKKKPAPKKVPSKKKVSGDSSDKGK